MPFRFRLVLQSFGFSSFSDLCCWAASTAGGTLAETALGPKQDVVIKPAKRFRPARRDREIDKREVRQS